jgi:hypothetical protein
VESILHLPKCVQSNTENEKCLVKTVAACSRCCFHGNCPVELRPELLFVPDVSMVTVLLRTELLFVHGVVSMVTVLLRPELLLVPDVSMVNVLLRTELLLVPDVSMVNVLLRTELLLVPDVSMVTVLLRAVPESVCNHVYNITCIHLISQLQSSVHFPNKTEDVPK